MELRPYQLDGITRIRDAFRKGVRRVLLWLATGGGKTVCFSFMMIETVERGGKCLMVVRGRKLVDQASKRLHRENAQHGVLMNGHWNLRPTAPIQICSIDTLMARNWRPFKGEKKLLIVIDEAHMAVSDGYREFLKDYQDAFIVAVTATPYSSKSMRHFADEIVHPVSVQDLISQGFLVPPRYFAPSEPDTSGIKVSRQTGDFVTSELAGLMDKSSITGDIISHWKKIADGRPTIAFAVDVKHSKHIAAQFTEAGIPAEHCDADTPEKERDEIIRRLEAGVTKVVTNVGILCTGVDIPKASCIIMARPTKSYNLYIQQAGRGTRPAPGKENFILLDHAGNVTRHGFITDEPDPCLEGKKQIGGGGVKPRTCKGCFAVVETFPCVACEWTPPREAAGPREVIQVEGELKEITGPSPLQRYECERFCEVEIDKCVAKGLNVWKAYYKTAEKFGDQAARLVFFRICKRNGISVAKKKNTGTDAFPFK